MTARQLPLALSHRPALGREDFLVAPCNEEAVALIDRWPEWPHPLLVLSGPESAGKTHLAEVWRARSGAQALAPARLGAALDDLPASGLLQARALLVDALDPDAPVGDTKTAAAREAAFCRLIDGAREHGVFMVLTARRPPAGWTVIRPDLHTRLSGAPHVALGAPDEILLTSLAVKLFADRQLAAPPAAVMSLIARVERSFGAVAAAVEAIDRASLARRRAVTPSLVQEVLDAMGEADPDSGP